MSKLENYFKTEVLDINNQLFNELANDPLWWQIIRKDKDLYVNIRKYNRINVYYRGASVMSLEYSKKNCAIKAKIHNYYLGVNGDVAKCLKEYYGEVELSPEEIVCKLDLIKLQVRRNNKYKSENTETDIVVNKSEKYIQSKLYQEGKYIDTEFQVQLDGTDIRIDLVSLTSNNLLQFEELKRISDQRLMSVNPEQSEILNQMELYSNFINDVSAIKHDDNLLIVNYYQTLLDIMDKINVLPAQFKGIKIDGLSNFVKLYIDGTSYYTKRTPKRKKRLLNLKKILEEHKVHSNIGEVIEKYDKISQ